MENQVVIVNKKWYLSKTIWVNVVATVAIAIQAATGKTIASPEIQLAILSGINLILKSCNQREYSLVDY